MHNPEMSKLEFSGNQLFDTKKAQTLIFTNVPLFSEPEGTRTPNLLIRSQVLYPIKLQVQNI